MKPILPPEPRTQPIILPSLSVDESTEFILPKGFRVAELGKPRVIESPFGRFELTMTAEERSIVVRRQRSMQRGVYPASDGEAIRAFDDAVRKAETTPIVLERVAAP